jgi:hypothetical protein
MTHAELAAGIVRARQIRDLGRRLPAPLEHGRGVRAGFAMQGRTQGPRLTSYERNAGAGRTEPESPAFRAKRVRRPGRRDVRRTTGAGAAWLRARASVGWGMPKHGGCRRRRGARGF